MAIDAGRPRLHRNVHRQRRLRPLVGEIHRLETMAAAAAEGTVRGHLRPDAPGHLQAVRIEFRRRIDHARHVPHQVTRGENHVHHPGDKWFRHMAIGALRANARRIGEVDRVTIIVRHALHLVARGAERVGGHHGGDTFIAAPYRKTAQQPDEQCADEGIDTTCQNSSFGGQGVPVSANLAWVGLRRIDLRQQRVSRHARIDGWLTHRNFSVDWMRHDPRFRTAGSPPR